jgi:hypothetical protein
MTFLRRLFGQKHNPPRQRIRICQQCGMPVGEHKEWCSILRAQQARQQRPAEASGSNPPSA